MDERLQKQLDFILEIDKEKNIFRQTHLSGHGRNENDAEHAWHMAIMAYLLQEYSNEKIDVARVMLMCLIHDVVEIDAGDTYAYDAEGLKTQKAREEAAKERLYSMLPEDQKADLVAIFDEFEERIDQMLFVSATPNVYEGEHEMLRAEQIIRPTGLLDPPIDVRPVEGQIDDLISEINKEVAKKNKVLVTTLTKRMAEDLTAYMKELDIRVKYLHSDIDTLERIEIVRDLRMGVFDVLVGINLLREGLDIPEVTLIAILDADKEGFLRSETSLVQTIGRAARNAEGHVIMYGDTITDSMRAAITETKRRREIQMAYNEEHGITPKTIQKAIRDVISITNEEAPEKSRGSLKKDTESMNRKELTEMIAKLTKKMNKAAAELNFEEAAELRDELKKYKIALRDYDD